MAQKTLKSKTVLLEGLRVETGSRQFKVIMDEPELMGGTNQGMTPTEFLLNTLGSCLTISISLYAKAMRVDLKELHVEVEGDIDSDGFLGLNKEAPIGFSDMRIHIYVESDSATSKVEKLLEKAKGRCPVSATLEGGITIKTINHINEKIEVN